MSATERLRALLDERGVEWTAPNSILRDDMTSWEAGGFYYEAFEIPDPDETFLLTAAHQDDLTPEQAVAATLGDVPRLPHFWTHDGTLHVELPKLPESISVRLPAQRDREVGSARVWQYTLGRGTCRIDVLNTGDCAGYECSEYIMHCDGCGHEFGHVLYNEDGDVWMSEPPNYCPNCGRKVVDE